MIIMHKYVLVEGENFYELPKFAKVKSVIAQGDWTAMYVLVDTEQKETEHRKFVVYMTGDSIKEDRFRLEFIGTVVHKDGRYILHVFEDLRERFW